jgi:hypothetical protein
LVSFIRSVCNGCADEIVRDNVSERVN